MAGNKVKQAMGFQKSSSPTTSKPEERTTPKRTQSCPSPSPGSSATKQSKTVFSRSFGVYFPRSSAQVQPRPPDVTDLLKVVEELRERECHLKTKIIEQKLLKQSAAIVPYLESEITSKNSEIEVCNKKIEGLECENERLKKESERLEIQVEEERTEKEKIVKEMEVQISELKRTIEEQKKTIEEQKKTISRSDSSLSTSSSNKLLSLNESGHNALHSRSNSTEEVLSVSQRFMGVVDVTSKTNLVVRNLKRGVALKPLEIVVNQDNNQQKRNEITDPKKEELEIERNPNHHQSEEISVVSSSIKCRVPRVPKPPPKPSSTTTTPLPSPTSSTTSSSSSDSSYSTEEMNSKSFSSAAPPPPPPPPPPMGRKTRVPPPPPPPPLTAKKTTEPPPPPPPPMAKKTPAPPPPPPLPSKGGKTGPTKVKRVPEVVEFYHSLMRRDSKKESGISGSDIPAAANARDMIGEIENRSAHQLAIKSDVETQGDFIKSLIKEVENATFSNIEDVVAFVKWLDDELSYLVDERAVLKHFEWPEQKADALREAAFGYCDLKKLELEASNFIDDIRQPCATALKKMQTSLEKLEHGAYNLSRLRESSTNKYKGFHIPTDWMLETGFVTQIKLASVKLAMKFMNRVSTELEAAGGAPELEELMLQGVRFAFRVHQFAGGFDAETMSAFQELRNKSKSCHIQCQNQQQQKLLCRSTPC
ncbi:hypothetical protein MKW94_020251 [Papaver nudicaule]|uniref:Protein CHUP1, chloroplastic n=1 Tax=Papaver nudicaule TaxID=74823 RepID=A0AA42B274_PAPNU|nr:hypothetical protein [Papaver nudicaule]